MSEGFVYLRSEPGLWTVGHYDGDGRWVPESDHGSTDDAAARCHYLNGGRPHTHAGCARCEADEKP